LSGQCAHITEIAWTGISQRQIEWQVLLFQIFSESVSPEKVNGVTCLPCGARHVIKINVSAADTFAKNAIREADQTRVTCGSGRVNG
jgi:hypothetical protein